MTSFDINNVNNPIPQPVQSIGYTKNIPVIRDKIDIPLPRENPYVSEGQMKHILTEKGINATKRRLEIAMALYYQNQAIHEENIKYMEHMAEILSLNSQEAYEAYILLVTNSLEVTDERIAAVKEIITNKDFVSDLKSLENSITELNDIIDQGVEEHIFVQKETISDIITDKVAENSVKDSDVKDEVSFKIDLNENNIEKSVDNDISEKEVLIQDKAQNKVINTIITKSGLEDSKSVNQHDEIHDINIKNNVKDLNSLNKGETNIINNRVHVIDNKEIQQKSDKVITEQFIPKDFKANDFDLKKISTQIDTILSLKKDIFSSFNNPISKGSELSKSDYIGIAKFSKPDNFFENIQTFEGGLRNFGMSDDVKSIYDKNSDNNDNSITFKKDNNNVFIQVKTNPQQDAKYYKVQSDINNLKDNIPFIALINGVPKLIEKNKNDIKILQVNLNINEDILNILSPKEVKTVIIDGKPNLFINTEKLINTEKPINITNTNLNNDSQLINNNTNISKDDTNTKPNIDNLLQSNNIFNKDPVYSIKNFDNKFYLSISENIPNESEINNLDSINTNPFSIPSNKDILIKNNLGNDKVLIEIPESFISDKLKTNTTNFNNIQTDKPLVNDLKISVKDGITSLNGNNKSITIHNFIKENLDISNLNQFEVAYVNNQPVINIKNNQVNSSNIMIPLNVIDNKNTFTMNNKPMTFDKISPQGSELSKNDYIGTAKFSKPDNFFENIQTFEGGLRNFGMPDDVKSIYDKNSDNNDNSITFKKDNNNVFIQVKTNPQQDAKYYKVQSDINKLKDNIPFIALINGAPKLIEKNKNDIKILQVNLNINEDLLNILSPKEVKTVIIDGKPNLFINTEKLINTEKPINITNTNLNNDSQLINNNTNISKEDTNTKLNIDNILQSDNNLDNKSLVKDQLNSSSNKTSLDNNYLVEIKQNIPLKLNQLKKEVFNFEYSQIKESFNNRINNIVNKSENIPVIINNMPVIINKFENKTLNIIPLNNSQEIPNYLEPKIADNKYVFIKLEDNKNVFIPKFKIENFIKDDINNFLTFKTNTPVETSEPTNNENILVKGFDNNNYIVPKQRKDFTLESFSELTDNKPVILSFDKDSNPVIIINKNNTDPINKPIISFETNPPNHNIIKPSENIQNTEKHRYDLGTINLGDKTNKLKGIETSNFIKPINIELKESNELNNLAVNKFIYKDNNKIYSLNINNKVENLVLNSELNKLFNKNNIAVFKDQIVSKVDNKIFLTNITPQLLNKSESLNKGINITKENGIIIFDNQDAKQLNIDSIPQEISSHNEPLFFKVSSNNKNLLNLLPNINISQNLNKDFVIVKNPEDSSLRLLPQDNLSDFGSELNFDKPLIINNDNKKGIVFKTPNIYNNEIKFLPFNNIIQNSEKVISSDIIKINNQYNLLIPDKDGIKLFNIDSNLNNTDTVDTKLKVKIDGKTFFIIPENETGEHLIIAENPSLNKIKYDLSSPIKAQMGKESIILFNNQNNKLQMITENKATSLSSLVTEPISSNINGSEFLFINVDKKVHKLPINNKVVDISKTIDAPINFGNLSFMVFDKNNNPKLINLDPKQLFKADKINQNLFITNDTETLLVIPDKSPKVININALSNPTLINKFSNELKNNILINNQNGSFILNKSHIENNRSELNENLLVNQNEQEFIFINGKKHSGFISKDIAIKYSDSLENIFIPNKDNSTFIFKDRSGLIKNSVIDNNLLNNPEKIKNILQVKVNDQTIIINPEHDDINIVNVKPEDKINESQSLKININNNSYNVVFDKSSPKLVNENVLKNIESYDFSKPVKVNIDGSDYVIFKSPEDLKIKLYPISNIQENEIQNISIESINDFEVSDLVNEFVSHDINSKISKPINDSLSNDYKIVLSVNNEGEILLKKINKQSQSDINIENIKNIGSDEILNTPSEIHEITSNGVLLSQIASVNVKPKDIKNVQEFKDQKVDEVEGLEPSEANNISQHTKSNKVDLSKYDVKISVDSLLNSVLSGSDNKNIVDSIKGLNLFLHKDQNKSDEVIITDDQNKEPLIFNIKEQKKEKYIPQEKYTLTQNISGKESLIIKSSNNKLNIVDIESKAFKTIEEPIIDENGDIIIPDKDTKSLFKLNQSALNNIPSKNINQSIFIKSDNIVTKKENGFIQAPLSDISVNEIKENNPFIVKIDGKENIILNHKGNLKQIPVNYLSGNIEKLKESSVFIQEGNTFLNFKDNILNDKLPDDITTDTNLPISTEKRNVNSNKNNILLNLDKITSVIDFSEPTVILNDKTYHLKNNKLVSDPTSKNSLPEISLNKPVKINSVLGEGIIFNDIKTDKIKFISNKDIEKNNLLNNSESINTGSNTYIVPRKDDLVKIKIQDKLLNNSSNLTNPKEISFDDKEQILIPDIKTHKFVIANKNEVLDKSSIVDNPFYIDHNDESYLLTNSKSGFRTIKTNDLNNKLQKIDTPVVFEKDNNIHIIKNDSSAFIIDKSILENVQDNNLLEGKSHNFDSFDSKTNENISSIKSFDILEKSDKLSSSKNNIDKSDIQTFISQSKSYIDKNTLFFKDNNNDFIVEVIPKKDFVKNASILNNISINGETYSLSGSKLIPDNKSLNPEVNVNKPIMIDSDLGQGLIYPDPISSKLKFINIQDIHKNNINNIIFDMTKNDFVSSDKKLNQNSFSENPSKDSFREAKSIEQNILFNNSATSQLSNNNKVIETEDFDTVQKINFESSDKKIDFKPENKPSDSTIEKMSFNSLLNSVLSGKDENQKKVESINGLNFFVKTGDENENKKNDKHDILSDNKSENINNISPMLTYGKDKKILLHENGEIKSIDISDITKFKKTDKPLIVEHQGKQKIITTDNIKPIIIDLENIDDKNLSNLYNNLQNSEELNKSKISQKNLNSINNELLKLPEIEVLKNDISKTKNIINNIVNNEILNTDIHHISTQINSVAMMYGALESHVKNLKSELKDFKKENDYDSESGILESLLSVNNTDTVKKNDKKRNNNEKLPFEALLKSILSEVYSKVEKVSLNLQGREILSNNEKCFCIPLSIPIGDLRFNGEVMVKQELDSRNKVNGKRSLNITLAVQTKTLNTILIDITNLDKDLQVSLKVENNEIKKLFDDKIEKLNNILKGSNYNVRPVTCSINKNIGRGNSLLIPKDTFPKSLKRIDGII